MHVQHFFDPNTWTLTYVVHDEESQQGVVIDPVMDFDPKNGRTRNESSEVVARLSMRTSSLSPTSSIPTPMLTI